MRVGHNPSICRAGEGLHEAFDQRAHRENNPLKRFPQLYEAALDEFSEILKQ